MYQLYTCMGWEEEVSVHTVHIASQIYILKWLLYMNTGIEGAKRLACVLVVCCLATKF